MSDKTYNGWTNYETWNVNLWIDNDQGSYSYWNEQAQDAYNDAEANSYNTREQAAINDLADRLKDLLGAALSEVNWYEIAEHMIEEVDKEEETEELQVGD